MQPRIPSVTFTGAPLKLPAGQFGMGHGDGAHAPDEYWIVESANPKVAGMDGATEFLGLTVKLGVTGRLPSADRTEST